MKGHPIRGLVAGILLGFVLAVDLFLGGVVESDSSVLVFVFIACVVVVFLLGVWAPIGRRRKPKEVTRPQPLPAPVAWPETAPIEGSTPPPPGSWKTAPKNRPPDNPAWGRVPPQAPPADPGAPPAAPPPAPPPPESI